MFGGLYKKEGGAVVIGGRHVSSTYQCVHCGNHIELYKNGRKVKVNWCYGCGGYVCFSRKCAVHIPFEAKVDYAEAKQAKNEKIISKLISQYPKIVNLII